MSLDLTTLRLLKRRDRYDKYAKNVPARALDAKMQLILKDFGRWFKEFPDAKRIDADAFSLAFASYHPTLKDEDLAVYRGLFKKVEAEEVGPELESGLLQRLQAAATAYDLAALIERFNAGEEVDVRKETEGLIREYDAQITRKIRDPQVRDSIEDMLKDEENDKGLHWRLACLNRHIKPIIPGDFIIVAARPDKGKTTFLSSEATFMAPQVDQLYPGENRSILWFNNEGPGKRIVMRCVQSSLGLTMEELVALSNQPPSSKWNAENKKDYKSKLRQDYADVIGGRPGVLRIMDIHDWWNHEIEEVIAQHKPALIIFDMIDNIKFGGGANNNGQRTDQLLEAMYQWARLIGVKYDAGVIANSQISADGDGLQWPTLGMLKDSKTGKQGAADVIITIGTVNDSMLENSRYIGTTKNKRVRTGVRGSPQQEVIFDGARGRYIETQ